ncbi:hypothetical protein NW765_001295 [Fusarium oxysporum]|nr:hypothetical protein NW765_001295 [Fusarium oxysporum]KAJ4280796.1 hypothetical protein NW764_005144 [Fusarium oxysporum]
MPASEDIAQAMLMRCFCPHDRVTPLTNFRHIAMWQEFKVRQQSAGVYQIGIKLLVEWLSKSDVVLHAGILNPSILGAVRPVSGKLQNAPSLPYNSCKSTKKGHLAGSNASDDTD